MVYERAVASGRALRRSSCRLILSQPAAAISARFDGLIRFIFEPRLLREIADWTVTVDLIHGLGAAHFTSKIAALASVDLMQGMLASKFEGQGKKRARIETRT